MNLVSSCEKFVIFMCSNGEGTKKMHTQRFRSINLKHFFFHNFPFEFTSGFTVPNVTWYMLLHIRYLFHFLGGIMSIFHRFPNQRPTCPQKNTNQWSMGIWNDYSTSRTKESHPQARALWTWTSTASLFYLFVLTNRSTTTNQQD